MFGSEPSDQEVYDFILKNSEEIKYSKPLEITSKDTKINPKRIKHKIQKELKQKGIGTKSQQALKLQIQSNKEENKDLRKKQKIILEDYKFKKRLEKIKQKHKGH